MMIERAKALYRPLQRVQGIGADQFERDFAIPQIPCVLEGMSDDWPARQRWLMEPLRQKYGRQPVFMTKSSTLKRIKTNLGDFISYVQTTQEEHGYYLKDWVFGDDFPEMKKEYQILPHFFNWLDTLPADLNPKFSWLYVGPANSYSPLHLDILLTNAWNILFEGKKLWLFFPPELQVQNLEFDPLFPGYNFPVSRDTVGYYAVQEPGEIMFTPGRWYHQVYNIERTVALTENYVNHTNYEVVEQHLKDTGKHDVLALLNMLKRQFLHAEVTGNR